MKTQKKLYSLILLMFLFIGSSVFASFPVKTVNNEKVANEEVVINKQNVEKKINSQINAEFSAAKTKVATTKAGGSDNEKLITILLWFFLGLFAAHRWYKKKPVGWNILFILTAGGCGIWAIIDLVHIITDKF